LKKNLIWLTLDDVVMQPNIPEAQDLGARLNSNLRTACSINFVLQFTNSSTVSSILRIIMSERRVDILIMGAKGVGKTSLVTRLLENRFDDDDKLRQDVVKLTIFYLTLISRFIAYISKRNAR
jgi:Cdc6-like AAA superfamily ATPase